MALQIEKTHLQTSWIKVDGSVIIKISQESNSLTKTFIKLKKTYGITLHLNSDKGYYSSCAGLGMYEIPTGEYSSVLELYFPSVSIDFKLVVILATSIVETISKVLANKFTDHAISLGHMHKYNNTTPDYLMIDLVLKNKAGVSYTQNLTIHMVV